MTTFQFIAGMVFCLAGLGVRAYLTVQHPGEEKAWRSSNVRKSAK
ncbi:hypothetical protein [Pseudomonas chlororaphis]|nr:hypothetical protein [Pseudomonas chlororaphis]AZD21876.1 hypothetical protein C4K24_2573 [Pseudomonas chlororaphis subsp. aurantiaca]AZD47996.1 hypothetical protein C4K20_2581 [Pseudomonas chlororaphis subsp. aurantiaca]AZD54412.1 hypothetical protein C4K19_2625 [Pseudomonas chlororaphis subsp. aurantiaca]AZD60477.1 hypothetical protein C4K18_2504 [Pseudomonas chlororaphis subsp. aurantiaca]AZD66447.1 hypothetical protein C4K17_2561 [Pseudomonas chlororaphis subsp. aurantiaca]